jgi:hypothetical protein
MSNGTAALFGGVNVIRQPLESPWISQSNLTLAPFGGVGQVYSTLRRFA